MTTGKANGVARNGVSFRRVAEDIAALAAGLGAGAGLMYLCDPDRGRARRNRVARASGLRREEPTLAKRGMVLLGRARGVVSEAASGIVPGHAAPGLLISVTAGLALFNRAKTVH